jgi:microcystin-dependent protein
VPIHEGNGHTLGEAAGSTSVTINIQQLPTHVHFAKAVQSNADTPVPTNNMLATSNNLYSQPTSLTSLQPSTVTNVGGSQPHNNMMPYLTLNFVIALQGIFPSQN